MTPFQKPLGNPFLSEVSMREHLQQGSAVALFPQASAGPVFFAGEWWAILKSAPGCGYSLVEDERMVAVLHDTALRINPSIVDSVNPAATVVTPAPNVVEATSFPPGVLEVDPFIEMAPPAQAPPLDTPDAFDTSALDAVCTKNPSAIPCLDPQPIDPVTAHAEGVPHSLEDSKPAFTSPSAGLP